MFDEPASAKYSDVHIDEHGSSRRSQTIDASKSILSQIRETSMAQTSQTIDSLQEMSSEYSVYERMVFGKIMMLISKVMMIVMKKVMMRMTLKYLERGVDVKFIDVAGLGKIRLELEEIVKLFYSWRNVSHERCQDSRWYSFMWNSWGGKHFTCKRCSWGSRSQTLLYLCISVCGNICRCWCISCPSIVPGS